ncbi:hypothetical protein RBH50_17570 [Escherichia coli]
MIILATISTTQENK